MKKLIFFFAFALLLPVSFFAQSSDQVSKILKSEILTYGEASYLPALYANLISENASETEAFAALQENEYFDSADDSGSLISLSVLANIYMKTFGFKGGLFYTITKSPRYAFKEFKARGFLPVEADPDMLITGRDAVDLFNSCLDVAEGDE